jgi:hypothetical protein
MVKDSFLSSAYISIHKLGVLLSIIVTIIFTMSPPDAEDLNGCT